MRRVIVVAHKGENHVYVRGTNGLYKEEVAVLPQMEDLRAKLTEMAIITGSRIPGIQVYSTNLLTRSTGNRYIETPLPRRQPIRDTEETNNK